MNSSEYEVKHFLGSRHDVVVNVLIFDTVVSEFELHSFYYVHFQINTLGKGMNPLIYWLNSTTTVLLKEALEHKITHEG